MKIAVLTSSRADYSIYFPLLKLLKADNFFDLKIIAFGTHLSSDFGNTVDHIIKDGFEVEHRIPLTLKFDSPLEITKLISSTISLFADFWANNSFDWIIALGDRYEMFAAVCATIPFNLKVAHIHGGETTLGAIDNVFRHSISHMSQLHFTSCDTYKNRVIELIGDSKNIYNVGALSIDNLTYLKLYTIEEFSELFNYDISKPFILITIHPETVTYDKNLEYINIFIQALEAIEGYNLVITMPNADTAGNLMRTQLQNFLSKATNAIGFESLGTIGYLSCMKYCSMLLGNSSSGFVEAAYFPKYVVNVGDRQKGRVITKNIIEVSFEKEEIISAIKKIKKSGQPEVIPMYGNGHASDKIIEILKSQ